MQWLNLEWIDVWGAGTVAHPQRLREAPPEYQWCWCRYASIWAGGKRKQKDKRLLWINLKIWSLSSHSWELIDLTWCLRGRLLIISICLCCPGCDCFCMKLLTNTSHQPRFCCSPLTKCGNLWSKPNADCFCGLVFKRPQSPQVFAGVMGH